MKTRLAHGFHFGKVKAGLNEPLMLASQIFATDRQVRAKNLIAHVRNSYVS